jgi:hypothetical protein
MMAISLKQLGVAALFSRWGRRCPSEDGYTIILPSPMDMPFLLRYALEGLGQIDTGRCKQIVVVPDGCVNDRGDALDRVIREFDDPRIDLIRPTALDYFLFRSMKPVGGAATHWMMAVIGTDHARCAHAFLHDADAFFLEADGLERQYSECLDRGMATLGVTARLDPFFADVGYEIPGTWELMFSTRWARRRSPYVLKNGWYRTPRGPFEFDSMLYRQYMDYPSGKVGVMSPSPRLVHFSGSIGTYRYYRMGRGKVDELFRLLLLAMLEDLIPSDDGTRTLPDVGEMTRGLTDPGAPVTYDSPVAVREYPIFRAMIDDLCDSPLFRGSRADRVRTLLQPFDDHFRDRVPDADVDARLGARTHGLGS